MSLRAVSSRVHLELMDGLLSQIKDFVKKTGFYIAMGIMVWILIEVTVFAVYSAKFHVWYPPRTMKEKIIKNIRTKNISENFYSNTDRWIRDGEAVQVIHPYVGYVFDPYRNLKRAGEISEFGFFQKDQRIPIRKKSPNEIIIGIFGGSFAASVYARSASLLRERLAITGQAISVLNFSRGGGKQPEQLAILAYMLSMGAEFDMVINIDGFNEVALPPVANIPKGVYPFYPRQWYYQANGIFSPYEIRQIGCIEVLKGWKDKWALFFLNNRLYRSAVLSLVWQYGDLHFKKAIYTTQQKVQAEMEVSEKFLITPNALDCLRRKGMSNETLNLLNPLSGEVFSRKDSFDEKVRRIIGEEVHDKHHIDILRCVSFSSEEYVVTGPKYVYASEEQLYHDLSAHWKQSSYQMNALCEANGIQYYHFLQPNQYVEDSKRMTAEEKRIALAAHHPYRAGVENGYPLLMELGCELTSLGVNFTDLTMIFKNNAAVLYDDDCCHLNGQGYDIIMEAILEKIRERNDL